MFPFGAVREQPLQQLFHSKLRLLIIYQLHFQFQECLTYLFAIIHHVHLYPVVGFCFLYLVSDF